MSIMINQIPHVRLITHDKCQAFVDCFISWTEEGNDTDEVVKSKKINFNPIKFKTFQDEFRTLLCSVRGGREITLGYIIRVGDIVTFPIEVAEPDVNSNGVLSKNTTLFGPDSTRDKSNVFIILRLIMTSPPGCNVISKHATRRNDRQAYIDLKANFRAVRTSI